jgi:type II secretory pathway pseudopilin PulG
MDLKPWRDQSPANASAELHLYLAGIELKTLILAPAEADVRDDTGRWLSKMTVTLDIADDKDPSRRRAWVQVLQSAMTTDRTPVSVGPAAGPFSSAAVINLRVFPSYTWLVVVFLAALLVALFVLGKWTNLLRDGGSDPNPPYSLSRHQMAVWFFVIVGGYLYVWLITGSAALSTTALVLMGISGATGLVAVTMDNAKRQEESRTRTALRAERDALDLLVNGASGLRAQQAAAAAGSPEALQVAAAAHTKGARLAELDAILSLPLPAAPQNRMWYLDLLSDENGISFHRLQMAIWTIVMVGVFIRAVYTDAVMPEFDATILGLMGIASGTYLGFKLPEKK